MRQREQPRIMWNYLSDKFGTLRKIGKDEWEGTCPICRTRSACVKRDNHGFNSECKFGCVHDTICRKIGVDPHTIIDFADAVPTNGNGAHGIGKPSDADLLAELRDGDWLDRQTFPDLRYVVPTVLPEGFALLVGPPKIGKSWLVLSIALAAAAGGYVFGPIRVARRPVLYLALEDGDRRLQDRCRQLLHGEPIPAAFEYLTRVQPGAVNDTIVAWLDRFPGSDENRPLVILDTLGRVMPPAMAGESSYSRDYRIGSGLKWIVDERPGMALLVNHHDRKAGGEDFVDSVSGTHGLAGAADTILVLDRKRNESTGLIRVTGRDVIEGEYALSFDSGCWNLDGADFSAAAQSATSARATAGLGDRMADVIDFVNQFPDGIQAASVAENVGIPANTARTYLRRAVAANPQRLVSPKRGIYAPVASVASVALNGNDPSERNTNNTRNTLSRSDDPAVTAILSGIPEQLGPASAEDVTTVVSIHSSTVNTSRNGHDARQVSAEESLVGFKPGTTNTLFEAEHDGPESPRFACILSKLPPAYRRPAYDKMKDMFLVGPSETARLKRIVAEHLSGKSQLLPI
jgi:hypothetical protein